RPRGGDPGRRHPRGGCGEQRHDGPRRLRPRGSGGCGPLRIPALPGAARPTDPTRAPQGGVVSAFEHRLRQPAGPRPASLPDPDPDTDSDAHADADAHAHANTDPDTHTHTHTDPDPDPDADADSDTHADADADAHADSDADADSDSDTH